ncbi:hypothetical protein [Cupriavidus sp. D39]|uniref:hypothetical protein n=1 Tax=Cupriavidus sp. D39 TaxID=2997877 RepID=UPI0022712848|nr:hypothetical protein [Cupriavidus sp. D39]MCY0855752.1 hypothetical protein [Cupriavidus sp. D39]
MNVLSWPSIAFYCVFAVCIYYQQLHLRNFRGRSQVFGFVLGLSALAGTLTGLAYLGYYGWTVAWWAPLVIFVIGLLASFTGVLVERIVGTLPLSLAAFLGWPVSTYFMFHYMPR